MVPMHGLLLTFDWRHGVQAFCHVKSTYASETLRGEGAYVLEFFSLWQAAHLLVAAHSSVIFPRPLLLIRRLIGAQCGAKTRRWGVTGIAKLSAGSLIHVPWTTAALQR